MEEGIHLLRDRRPVGRGLPLGPTQLIRESWACVELQLDVVGVAKGQSDPAAVRVVLGLSDLRAQLAEPLRELLKL
jgi:hypothetical protein